MTFGVLCCIPRGKHELESYAQGGRHMTARADDGGVEYIADPSMADQPLTLVEIQELAQNEGRALRSDPRKVSHFLARIEATMKRHQEESRQLRSEVERGRVNSSTIGQATTLSPADAVRYLSPEDLQKLFGAHSQQQLEYMKMKQAEADAATRRATQLVNSVKYILGGAESDPQALQNPVIAQLVQLLRSVEAPVVQQPSPQSLTNPWVVEASPTEPRQG